MAKSCLIGDRPSSKIFSLVMGICPHLEVWTRVNFTKRMATAATEQKSETNACYKLVFIATT